MGHETKMRWNDEDEWIWSAEVVHQPLIDEETFAAVRHQMQTGRQRAVHRKPRSSPRPFVLRRLISCGLCGRRMEATWNHGRAHYRCRYPGAYALSNGIEHPKALYVREDAIVVRLDNWLAQVFDPAHLDAARWQAGGDR